MRSSSTARRRSRAWRSCGSLAEEGLGADVSTLGELRFARRAGRRGRAARRARQQQVATRSSPQPPKRACVRRPRLASRSSSARVRPASSGCSSASRRDRGGHPRVDPDGPRRLEVRRPAGGGARARAARVDGLHVHVGSQLLGTLRRARRSRGSTGSSTRPAGRRGRRPRRRARRSDAPDETAPSIDGYVGTAARRRSPWSARVILEPGRSLVGRRRA